MIIVGVDEVGRGCWAGPLVAGAVILSEHIAGLKDSKKLSKLQRKQLSMQIKSYASTYNLGWVSSTEVDNLGLSSAVKLAMQRAIDGIVVDYDKIIIDGNINYFPEDARSTALVKADESVPEVSAASILAKVARDEWMQREAAMQYPQYHFEKHVGYGTALHRELLEKYGVSNLHRLSFKPVQSMLRYGSNP